LNAKTAPQGVTIAREFTPEYHDDDLNNFGDRIIKAECSDIDWDSGETVLYIPEDSELGRELVARGLVDNHNTHETISRDQEERSNVVRLRPHLSGQA